MPGDFNVTLTEHGGFDVTETRVIPMRGECAQIGGQLDMTGLNLVKHHLQQAELAARFLPGGKAAGDLMEPIFEQLYLTKEEAADAVRTDVSAALAALEELPNE